MNDSESYPTGGKLSDRLYHFLEKVWPSIYIAINGLFYGIINFIKFLFAGLWPGK